MKLDTATFARLCELLLAPDPDVPSPARPGAHRGSHVTYPGDPKRRQTVMLQLMTAWLQHRYLSVDPAPFIGAARPQRLRLARRIA